MSAEVVRKILSEGPATSREIAISTGFAPREAVIRCWYLHHGGQIEEAGKVDPDPEVRWSKRPILWRLTPRGEAMARADRRARQRFQT